MKRVTISCESCERLWSLNYTLSLFEKQSLESRPCPHCGAYTLACYDSEEPAALATPKAYTWNAASF